MFASQTKEMNLQKSIEARDANVTECNATIEQLTRNFEGCARLLRETVILLSTMSPPASFPEYIQAAAMKFISLIEPTEEDLGDKAPPNKKNRLT